MYTILLLIALGIVTYTATSGQREYARFEAGKMSRLALYQRWITESWILFGLFSVVALALTKPAFLVEPIVRTSLFTTSANDSSDHIQSIIIGIIVGVTLALGIVAFRIRRSVKKANAAPLPPLVPTTSDERKSAFFMSITAGITEELLFRAAIPAFAYLATGNANIAIAISIVSFGLEHYYQGWKGVLGTAVLGWLFLKVFMLSGTIIVPMLFHAALDIYGLLLYPMFVRRVGRGI